MPEYNIVTENRDYRVELVKKEGQGIFEAKINNKPVELKIDRRNGIKAISPFMLTVAGKTYTIEFERIDRHEPFILKIDTMPFKLKFKEPERRIAEQVPTTQVMSRTRQIGKKTI